MFLYTHTYTRTHKHDLVVQLATAVWFKYPQGSLRSCMYTHTHTTHNTPNYTHHHLLDLCRCVCVCVELVACPGCVCSCVFIQVHPPPHRLPLPKVRGQETSFCHFSCRGTNCFANIGKTFCTPNMDMDKLITGF